MVDDTPDDIVFEVHNEVLWGDHPYGFSILGTRETVGSLTGPQLRALHARAYVPGNVVVAAAGSVPHEKIVEQLLAAGWGDIKAGSETGVQRSLPPVAPPPSTRIVGRDTAQAHLVLGSPTVPHADERRHAHIDHRREELVPGKTAQEDQPAHRRHHRPAETL